MKGVLAPEVVEKVLEARPELSKEQVEAVSILFASSAVTLSQATADIPMPFSIMYGANLFATALLPLYVEHNLVNVEAVTEYINKVQSGEIKVEQEAEEQDRKGRVRGRLGFQFSRD